MGMREVVLAALVGALIVIAAVAVPALALESPGFHAVVYPVALALFVPYAWLTNFIVRKAAHFSEYAVLGIISWGFFSARLRERGRAPFPIAFLVALVPLCDEGIQLFVPGRSGQLTDVLIDLSGVCFGALLATILSALRRRRV